MLLYTVEAVHLNTEQDSHLMMNHAFEIIGRVTNDLSVRVDQALDFGMDYGINGTQMLWQTC